MGIKYNRFKKNIYIFLFQPCFTNSDYVNHDSKIEYMVSQGKQSQNYCMHASEEIIIESIVWPCKRKALDCCASRNHALPPPYIAFGDVQQSITPVGLPLKKAIIVLSRRDKTRLFWQNLLSLVSKEKLEKSLFLFLFFSVSSGLSFFESLFLLLPKR